MQTYGAHVAAVKAIAWSPHQHGLLASGGGTADRCVRFWNTLTAQPMQCVDTGGLRNVLTTTLSFHIILLLCGHLSRCQTVAEFVNFAVRRFIKRHIHWYTRDKCQLRRKYSLTKQSILTKLDSRTILGTQTANTSHHRPLLKVLKYLYCSNYGVC